VRVDLWGTRGSIPSPGPETIRYGGNTSCVGVTLADGSLVVLDAGTGIRGLGLALPTEPTRIHFAPLFSPDAEVVIWGPASPAKWGLRDRIARYISAPLSPVEVRELPCDVSFRASPQEWEIGGARITAAAVAHRGPTLGYRIDDAGSSLAYIPDHEPALGADLERLEPEWISGFALAQGADLLIHDGQYSDEEYDAHLGWGHSALSHSLAFAARAEVGRTLLFHHDPLHSDAWLDGHAERAASAWEERGGASGTVDLAREGASLHIGAGRPTATVSVAGA
jgi:phosphoribosyl 1,2-cyclic phosphodiesterase